MTPDEQRLKGFTKLLKNQYQADPIFKGVQPHEKTDGGVYVFEVPVSPTATRRCFYWHFIPAVAGGQMAMNIADGEATAAEVVDGWMAYRKAASKQRG